MVEELLQRNLQNINTLRDEVHWDETAEENVESKCWESTPIYVVGEKFGRGLDISNVSYVFLTAPPTSAAAYTHLAGRTGRGNKIGKAITLVQGMKEAIRLATISDLLAIPFEPLNLTFDSSVIIKNDQVSHSENENLNEREDGVESMNYDDFNLNQLKDMLREKGLKVSGRKSELVERLKDSN
jgi:superfamily II DNA/RNA helicase